MDRAAADQSLTSEERTALIVELAATPDVAVFCLDPTFRSCPLPDAIRELGVGAETEPVNIGELRDQVTPRENASLMAAIGRARRHGAGDCVIRQPDNDEPLTIVFVDLVDTFGVSVAFSGVHLQPSAATANSSGEAMRPRRIVHHRNEVAELIWVDPLTKDMLGIDPDEMIGHSALDYIHPDDHDRGIDAWLALLAGEPPVRYRSRWRNGEGDWVWIETTHTDRLDRDGYIETELVDVDDEMRALARAREGEVRFRTLTESLPVGVAHIGAGGVALYVNSWLRDFAFDDVDAPLSSRLSPIHDEDQGTLNTAFRDAIGNGTESDFDVRIQSRRHGSERVCRVRVRPVGDESDEGGRTAIASIEDITDSAELEAQLRHQAMTDELTGLANRAALIERLQPRLDEVDRHESVAALFLDLDGFKMINDGLGHDAGDDLLIEISHRLARCLRPEDQVARVGGDEFVIIINECTDLGHAAAVAERLIEACEEPVQIDDTSAKISCSVGIALVDPYQAHPATELLTNADLAMYKAKRAGGGQWANYDNRLRSTMTRTFELQRGILDSLENNEFSLFLQPLRNLKTGQTVGAECLVRWNHPVHGLTGTDQFIPIAEQSGLIVPLGRWILDSACRIAARAAAVGREDLRISVNISGRQLAQSGFVDEFLETADRYGISPSQLILEVTETVFVGTDGDAVEMLRAIKRSGCTIALDDFGTGYSSLNQLRLMPASMIKIDGSYIGDLEADTGTKAITKAMVELSRELGLELIAEGVETAEQLHTLQLMDVELGQGYLLGRPAPEEEFFAAIRRRQLARLADPTDDDNLIL